MEKIKNKEHYLPKKFFGKSIKKSLTKTAPRRWTPGENNWVLELRKKGFSNKHIAGFTKRSNTSVELQMKRLGKKNGKTYNLVHRVDKYVQNYKFIELLDCKSILDLYSGEKSCYIGKVNKVCTNDTDKRFKTDYTVKAEKLVVDLFFENKKFDIVDIDPFGSGYDCINYGIRIAKKGIIITLGEMGHLRWKRLGYVRTHHDINTLEEFTTENIIKSIIKIGLRNKKKLTPVIISDYRNISRVYFTIEKVKMTEQWD
jgi:hypothetical protein